MSAPVTVADARAKARTRVTRSYAGWLVGDEATFELPLHVPSERAVLRSQSAAEAWAASWEGVDGVVWGTRVWRSAGTHRVPERLALSGADRIAAFGGGEPARVWRAASASASAVREVLGDSVEDALRSSAARLAALSPAEATRVARAALWLRENSSAGLRIRQVPIPGVDTKWLAHHTGLLAALLGTSLDLAPQAVLVRMRVLDEALWPDGPRTMLAPASEWDRVRLRPSVVLIVENLETLLALPPLPGVVAVHGSGYGTWSRLGDIGWLTAAPRILYWGDLDSHGFGVLNEVLAACPRVESLLMDASTLREHREVWGVEPKPAPLVLSHLRPDEQAVRDLLAAEGNVRLEQERVLWPWAMERLGAALV